MKKDLLYMSSCEEIEKVHVGFFPVKGRYFRTEMQGRGNGIFELTVDLPKGRSFFHYFLNENFDKPVNNNGAMISQYDALKRSPLIFETEVFCPVQFENSSTFINHIKDNEWEIKAITHQQWIDHVSIIINAEEFPLSKQYYYKNKSYWSTRIHLDKDKIEYCIKISGSQQIKYLHNSNRLENHINKDFLMVLNLSGQAVNNPVIKGLQKGYQIFPDRFFKNGDSVLDIDIKNWGDEPDNYAYFGGTLQGITEKLDYISSLGVEFIYLNPIFISGSYHRYDCTDYLRIDPLLGSESDFEILVNEISNRNMKLILDISLNHCSRDFFAFKDICEKGSESEYLDWFEIYSLPLSPGRNHQYSCWHGYQELPQFNLSNQEVRKYFSDVAEYWMGKYNISGWRLDVCTEMSEDFIKSFTQKVKTVNPEAIIIAENWHNTSFVFSSECRIDGYTNYSLYLDIFTPFFVQENISLNTLASKIFEMNYRNSSRINQLSWNFLSNHDLPRFRSIIKDKEKYKLAYVLLYALPGTPVIYYGEETEMEGLGDPLNRGCMNFEVPDGENGSLQELLKKLNAVRKEYEDIFNYGSMSFPFVGNKEKKLVIRRNFNGESLFFYFNFDTVFHQFTIDKNTPEAVLPPKSFKVLHYSEITDQILTILPISSPETENLSQIF